MLEVAIYRLAIFCTKASNCPSATTIQVRDIKCRAPCSPNNGIASNVSTS